MAAPAASAGGPPGLSSSVGESSTASRERRRVALAAKVAVQELSSEVREQFGALLRKFDLVALSLQTDLMDRISRLETLTVCGSPLEPSVNEVLNEMLLKKVSSDGAGRKTSSSRKCINYSICTEDELDMDSQAARCTSTLVGEWEPLPPEPVVLGHAPGHPTVVVQPACGSKVGDVGWTHIDGGLRADAIAASPTQHSLTKCFADASRTDWRSLPSDAWHKLYKDFAIRFPTPARPAGAVDPDDPHSFMYALKQKMAENNKILVDAFASD